MGGRRRAGWSSCGACSGAHHLGDADGGPWPGKHSSERRVDHLPNHLSSVDPPLVFIMLPGRKQTVFVADKYRHHPFYRPIGPWWIVFGKSWRHPALDHPSRRAGAAGRLGAGVAPEGTRSPTHALQQGRPGRCIWLCLGGAHRAGGLAGTEKAIPSRCGLRARRMSATFGKPIFFGEPAAAHAPTTSN